MRVDQRASHNLVGTERLPLGFGFYLGIVVTGLSGLALLGVILSWFYRDLATDISPTAYGLTYGLLFVIGLYLVWSGYALRPPPFRVERSSSAIDVYGTTKRALFSPFYGVATFFFGFAAITFLVVGIYEPIVAGPSTTQDWLGLLGKTIVFLLLASLTFVTFYFPLMARLALRTKAGPTLRLTDLDLHFRQLLPALTLPPIRWAELTTITPYERRQANDEGGTDVVKLLGLTLTEAGRSRLLQLESASATTINQLQAAGFAKTPSMEHETILIPATSLPLSLSKLMELLQDWPAAKPLVRPLISLTETPELTKVVNTFSNRFSRGHPGRLLNKIPGLIHQDED